jgi:glycerophosphoryl diester phosphodiesterase
MNLSLFSLAAVLAAVFAASCASGLEIVAHRGASHDAPENTLASFKLGFEQKADADECDVYLTKDGRIVVMHDKDTGRTSGVTNKIADSTFEQLRRLDIGKWGQWKDKGFSEEIPALEEVLALVPEGKRLFIEIKCGPEILPELDKTLRESGKKAEQLVIIGFGYETVRQAKEKMPHLQVFFLAAADNKTKKFPPVEDLIKAAKAANLDGLDVHSGFPIDAAFVSQVHAAGLKLYTWTVDDPEVARKEAAAGVDGITTNRPEWLRAQLGKVAARPAERAAKPLEP